MTHKPLATNDLALGGKTGKTMPEAFTQLWLRFLWACATDKRLTLDGTMGEIDMQSPYPIDPHLSQQLFVSSSPEGHHHDRSTAHGTTRGPAANREAVPTDLPTPSCPADHCMVDSLVLPGDRSALPGIHSKKQQKPRRVKEQPPIQWTFGRRRSHRGS